MTRKKFVKSCMGVGISRNMAAQLAVTARTKYGPYWNGLGLFLNTFGLMLHGMDPSGLYRAQGGGRQ